MRDRSQTLSVVLVVVLIVGVLLLGGVLGLYFFYFHGPISLDINAWASFGNFLSGTLGPIFAFLTFIGLLFTISIQAKQLVLSDETLKATQQALKLTRDAAEQQAKQFREEMTKSELFNMIKFVHSELEQRFEKRAEFSSGGNNFGYYFSYSAPSAGLWEIPANGKPVYDNDRVLLADLCELMTELNMYLQQYEAQCGPSALTYFYKKRYLTAANRLIEKGFLLKEMLPAFQVVGYGWTAPQKNDQSSNSEPGAGAPQPGP